MPIVSVQLTPPTSELPSGVETVAGECRLAPQYPAGFGGDVGLATVVPSGDPSGWTRNTFVANPSTARGVGIRRPSMWSTTSNGTNGHECLWQTPSGANFDACGFVELSRTVSGAISGGLQFGDPTGSAQASVAIVSDATVPIARLTATVSGSAGVSLTLIHEVVNWLQTRLWVRLRRTGNSFNTYYAWGDAPTAWTELGTTRGFTVTGMPNLGWRFTSGSSAGSLAWLNASPVTNWPFFLTSSPQIIREYDSGWAATPWDLATFSERPTAAPRSYAQPASGDLYSYVASDVSGAAFTQVDRTLSQVQAGGVIAGRYLRLGVKLPAANGYEDSRWSGATLNANVASIAAAFGAGLLFVPL
jgi:hypothetical protein